MLYALVGAVGLSPGAAAVDVGCGEGTHALELAERFRFTVTGVDPVARHIELATSDWCASPSDARSSAAVSASSLVSPKPFPVEDGSANLVWCRNVLVHVAELTPAYLEFRRILRDGGRVLVYQMFGSERLEPREADWLWKTMGVVPTSADPALTEAAISAAGLRVDEHIELGTEWGEWAEEQTGKGGGRRLLYASRLLRDPQRYIARFGRSAYDIMLGDCLWHVYGMIGKLDRRVYVLSRA